MHDEGVGGWIILDEPELHLRDDILVPDLAGWRRETMPELPDEPFTTLRPDWLCEVLSRSTEQRDRSDKLPVYAREGVQHIWFVDPEIQTLEVFRLDGDSYRIITTERGSGTYRLEPFEEIELILAKLWSR
jgi:Uma2 family endonuclease